MTDAEFLEQLRERTDIVLVYNSGARWLLEIVGRKPEHFSSKRDALKFVLNNGHDERSVLVVMPGMSIA
jgi:site-specific recombinase XerD